MKHWRGQPDGWTWKPSPRDTARFWMGLGVVLYSLSVTAYLSPWTSSYMGFLGAARRVFFNIFGTNGDVIVFATIGTVCLVCGVLKYKRNQ